MRTKDFCTAIEAAIQEAFGETVAFETLPFLDDHGEPQECLGIVIVKKWHFAVITAYAAHWVMKDPDALWPDLDGDERLDVLEDFANLVGGMKVAPYMQWTAIYFPGLTEEQVLGSSESGHDPLLVSDTAAGRDPVTGLKPNELAPEDGGGPEPQPTTFDHSQETQP